MGMFDFVKGKAGAEAAEVNTFPAVLGAVSKGTFVDMEQIPLASAVEWIPMRGRCMPPSAGK